MIVVLLGTKRNSPELHWLLLASSDLTQEVSGYCPLASLLASLFSCLMGVVIYMTQKRKKTFTATCCRAP